MNINDMTDSELLEQHEIISTIILNDEPLLTELTLYALMSNEIRRRGLLDNEKIIDTEKKD